jgi:TetR/AcrR family tetracycline transcriptional repressor
MSPKRKPRKLRPPLDRDRIVGEALTLIDEQGLGALSMRRLAERLSVYPTAIYWYVQTRSGLLAAVVEMVLGNILPLETEYGVSWQDWLVALMRAYRTAIMRHPNVAPLLGADLTSNPGVDITIVEGVLSKLEQAGFRDSNLLHAYNCVMASMIGFVTLELATAPSDGERWALALHRRYHEADSDRFPTIRRWVAKMENRAFVVRWQNGAVAPMDETFERFVAVLLIGLETQLKEDIKR